MVRRDGRVQAAGHPADHARLGVAEERLDELCGIPGVIDQVARSAALDGRVKGAARRAMSPALAIRFTLLMTLIPDADYPEVIEHPARRPGPGALAAAVPGAHRGGGLHLAGGARPGAAGAAAGPGAGRHRRRAPRARLPRRHRGGPGGRLDRRVADPGAGHPGQPGGVRVGGHRRRLRRPYPQLRELRISAASTRATFGVATGPSGAGGARDKGEAEQVLLDKALKDYRYLFTPDRLWVMDRNFPGVPRIKAMLAAGTHVLIRVKDGITLRRTGDFLPDGSYLAEISGGGITLTVRVIEYTVTVAGRDAPELFCLITDLHDQQAYPAGDARAGLPLAVDRLGNLPEGGQVRDQRRRAVHRADAPLRIPGPDRPGTRRLGDRRRAGPRHRPRRRRGRRPGPQGTPRRAAGAPPGDLVHRRPPGRHRLRPVRRGHRQPARPP